MVDGDPPTVQAAVELASGPFWGWSDAHEAFGHLRDNTLELDDRGELTAAEERLHRLILLAELVAKVTYNESDPIGPFDEDSGWNILPAALDLVRVDASSEQKVWAALLESGRDGDE